VIYSREWIIYYVCTALIRYDTHHHLGDAKAIWEFMGLWVFDHQRFFWIKKAAMGVAEL
jgi:hypothetical protein